MAETGPSRGVSVFDLDRTITRRGTYLPFLVFAAARLRPWRLALLPAVFAEMAAYKLGVFSRKRLKERMQRRLLGPRTAGADARRLAEAFAARLLARGCRSEAVDLIAAERAAGRTVLIATAAHRLYAEPLARRLGVEHVVATRSVWEGGELLSRIDGPNLYGAEKAEAVKRALAELGRGGAVRVYSDHLSDRPLFELADEPAAVNPHRALRRWAQARGWRVIDGRPARRPAPAERG